KRAKAKDARSSASTDTRRSDFKFQRVPGVTKIVGVRSSTFGAFAAIRKDCDVTRDQIGIDDQSLWADISPLLVLRGFLASEPPSSDKVTLGLWDADSLRINLGILPYELLKSPDLDADLQRHLRGASFNDANDICYDMLVGTSSSPEILIPMHGW